MNKMHNTHSLGNYLKRPTRLLAALALASGLGTVTQAQITYTPTFTYVWTVNAGNYTDLPANAGNNVRGAAINPVTTNVLYASSTGGT